jgi:signal transduction histidine kinase
MAELDLEASAVVDAIDDALVVVSGAGDILECNDAFEDILGDHARSTGPVETVVEGLPALETQLERREEGIVPVEADDSTRFFELSVSELDADTDIDPSLVVLHEVTDQQRQQRELERENEQLDQFASFISHDLRNPLDVAIGRTTVIDELVDDPQVEEHLSEIRASHARMIRIIQDVLTLARQGQSIDEKLVVDLSNIATSAWSHVETADAALDISTDVSIEADPDRLTQVFENLFRNSVEHGTADAEALEKPITVTVGGLDEQSGFYVADDGDGIDGDLRGQVLEAGFSAADGTGLGLAIVSNIATAHGWDITVTESAAGGARFDFTGVDIAASE